MAAQITNSGLGSVIAGGNFWKGAEQGVIATTYNHAVHGLYNKITEDGESPYDGYKKDKNGNYIRVDGRGGDKIDYLYDEEGNIIASTPVSFTEIEVGPYRRTYGQGTKYVSPALYDPTFDVFAYYFGLKTASIPLRYISSTRLFRKNVLSISKTNEGGRVITLFNTLKYVGKRSSTTGTRGGYSRSIKIRWNKKDYHIHDWNNWRDFFRPKKRK